MNKSVLIIVVFFVAIFLFSVYKFFTYSFGAALGTDSEDLTHILSENYSSHAIKNESPVLELSKQDFLSSPLSVSDELMSEYSNSERINIGEVLDVDSQDSFSSTSGSPRNIGEEIDADDSNYHYFYSNQEQDIGEQLDADNVRDATRTFEFKAEKNIGDLLNPDEAVSGKNILNSRPRILGRVIEADKTAID